MEINKSERWTLQMYDEDCVRDANNWRKAVPTGGNMVDITYLWCYHVTITAFVRKVAEWGGKWEVLTKKEDSTYSVTLVK